MKNILFIAFCLVLATRCNMNPSKEARLQKLEAEMKAANEEIELLRERCHNLETKIQLIENTN